MSTIPPNWLGSIIQAQGAKARAAEEKQKEQASQIERSGKAGFAEKLQDVIGSDDRDSQVYSDAEGSGSQGAPFEDQPEQEQPQEQTDQQDDDPAGGLDLQA